MDWSRAKSVLIFAFLLLNVLLGYQLWNDMQQRLNSNVDLTQLPAETLRIMQQKNIRLSGNIPTETPSLRELAFRFVSKPGQELSMLETPVNSRIIFNEAELLAELGDVIPDLDQYSFDATLRRDDAFVLYRNVDGLPMFNIKLELYFSNQKIVGYRQEVVELTDTGNLPEKQPILSATKAVGNLIENYLQAGTVVQEIRLGYHGQIFDSDDLQAATPAWRVLLEDGEVYYVQAISGEVATDKEPEASNGQGTTE